MRRIFRYRFVKHIGALRTDQWSPFEGNVYAGP
jgi:hypothetical protein